ncbi:MAG: hypothetical protein KTR27_19835 [Leptolyngbyaceae cyanobacterium MAG.088]|nr:hypothetical protein [Leptolyngbyaceae cyanobacterium MAG.088]
MANANIFGEHLPLLSHRCPNKAEFMKSISLALLLSLSMAQPALSDAGDFVRIATDEDHWDKPSDSNIQIFNEYLVNNSSSTLELANPLIKIVKNLYQLELLSDQFYQRLLIEIEQGTTTRRSRLLAALTEQELTEDRNSYLPEQYVDAEFSLDTSELTAGALSYLPESLSEFIVEFEETHDGSIADGFSAEIM